MNVAPLQVAPQQRERWLTCGEAAEALRAEYGFLTTARTLAKWVNGGKGMPSQIHFGRRMVRVSEILPWLKAHGKVGEYE